MAIVTAEKIFVDVNDEINFVVEKFLAAENERVILVCPQNALIVSSQVSIKILVKQMLKSKKQLVLVTEDAYGQQVAESAGLIAADKVSQITAQTWEIAAARKETLQEQQENRKQELLAQRGIVETEAQKSENAAFAAANAAATAKAKADAAEAPATDVEEADGVLPEDEAVLEVVEESAEADSNSESMLESATPELKGAIQRKRPEPKLVEMGSLQIMGGGDISTLVNEEQPMAAEKTPGERDMQVQDNKLKGGFTGKDWTKYTQTQKKSILAKLPFFGPKQKFRGEEAIARAEKRRKVIIISVVSGLLLFLGLLYLILFVWSSVDVQIELLKTEVPIEQTINIDTEVAEVDVDTVTIPAIEVVEDELSGSISATANGEGIRGDKAAGLIEIWNKTEAEVKLKKGTIVKTIAGEKQYTLQEDVTLGAATREEDDEEVVQFGGLDKEWRIAAVEVGEEFNITSGETIDFSVGEFETKDLIGKGFKDIDGGTSETFVSVSEANFEEAKKSLLEDLNKQGKDRLVAPSGYRLIEGTEVFEETESSSVPEVGEEADEFSVTVEGTMTALAVLEEDLNDAIQVLITRNQAEESVGENGTEAKDESLFEVTGLENAAITEVKRDDSKANFVVRSKGSLQQVLTDDDVKNALLNKSMEEARTYLEELPSVDSYTLFFSPGFVPGGLQRVPGDPNRISVTIK